MLKIVLSEKGQIVIPVELRKRYGLKKGDRLVVEDRDGMIVLRPLSKHPFLDLRGKFKSPPGEEKLTAALLKERAKERAAERNRASREKF
ncbi:MAG: AbrB/MazE/SpoVT family DNA-binding domain-containing protein [Bacillota bacterium]